MAGPRCRMRGEGRKKRSSHASEFKPATEVLGGFFPETGGRTVSVAGARVAVVRFLFRLPNRKLAGVGQSGLHPEAGQNPAIDDVPGGEDAEQAEQIHGISP
jgi:hypothetical protein